LGGVDVDDIEAGVAGAQRGVAMPAPEFADIGFIHRARLVGNADRIGHVGHVHRDFVGKQVGAARAADPELGAGERAVLVHHLGHQRVRPDIALVPHRRVGMRQVVRGRMYRTILGTDHAPAALGFDAAQRGHHARSQPAEAGAVRHLVEPVGRGDRPDPDRLEENVVACVSGHIQVSLVIVCCGVIGRVDRPGTGRTKCDRF
jgi:hypothetical protein